MRDKFPSSPFLSFPQRTNIRCSSWRLSRLPLIVKTYIVSPIIRRSEFKAKPFSHWYIQIKNADSLENVVKTVRFQRGRYKTKTCTGNWNSKWERRMLQHVVLVSISMKWRVSDVIGKWRKAGNLYFSVRLFSKNVSPYEYIRAYR